MTRSVEETTSLPRSCVVQSWLSMARSQLAEAERCLQRAVDEAHYIANGELLRQIQIARTQTQTADLWAASAERQNAEIAP